MGDTREYRLGRNDEGEKDTRNKEDYTEPTSKD